MRPYVSILAAGMLSVLGCSHAMRDRLAHFFFEIPPPAVADEEATQANDKQGSVRLASDSGSKWRIHQPVVERKCVACHDASNRMEPIEDLEVSCGSCHEAYFDRANITHPPVRKQDCMECHAPHQAEHPALLWWSVIDTCLGCHDEPEDLSQEHHSDERLVEHCTACHDPHFGKDFRLKEGWPLPLDQVP